MDVKRWGFTPGFCDEPGEFEETPDGAYVSFEDYAALREHAETLAEALEMVQENISFDDDEQRAIREALDAYRKDHPKEGK